MPDLPSITLLDLAETAIAEAKRVTSFYASSPGGFAGGSKGRDLSLRAAAARKALVDRIEDMYRAVEAIEAIDRRIDDRDNAGRNAVPPTGDDYNEVLAIVRSSFHGLIDPDLMA